ncbi:MAG: TrmH family RNA methyltransferase [Dehalococcoidia bacterium]
MAVISSLKNPTVKQIRALRRRAERERTGLFFVEGLQSCRAALEAQVEIEALVLAPSLITAASAWPVIQSHCSAGGRTLEVSSQVFARLSTRDRPQGVALVGRQRWQHLPSPVSTDEVWVALCGVQQPGNAGTVIRTCDAVGAAGLILLGPTVDPYDPVALRAATGTLFSQRMIRADVHQFVAWARSQALPIIGTSGEGGRDFRTLSYRAPLVLLMGAERGGLPEVLLGVCDAVAHIPMAGSADSLNLGVATGVMLYEAVRQRPPTPAVASDS